LRRAGAGTRVDAGPVGFDDVPSGVVLVTGGSRGIGAAVALGAAADGWTVCLTYRDDEVAARRVVADIESAGGTAAAVRADVAVEADVLAAFAAADAMGPVTGLVANAGIVAPRARVDEMTAERVERMLAVNVLGPFVCCRAAVRRMSTAHGGTGGSIVLISSVASRLGSPGQYVDYAASKGAVDTLGLGLAREVASEGVRVNVVRPGIIDTEIHASGGEPDRVARIAPSVPMGRAGRADEVAAATCWLLGDLSGYCTGTLLDVAGGR
jgi:NAD(P)-dependent dehydrogenase (short-subunit alcohol dehydrogenase family)